MTRDAMSRRVVRAALALLLLALLVVGVPLGLLLAGGVPLPAGVPTIPELSEALTTGQVADSTILKILAAVCWLAWTQLMVSVTVEVVATLRGRLAPDLPGARVAQRCIRALVAAVTVGASTLAVAGPPSREAPRPVNELVVELAALTRPADGPGSVVVESGDTLWDIAEEKLAEGARWPEIHEHNAGRPQPDGRALSDPDLILPGWELEMPTGPVEPDDVEGVAEGDGVTATDAGDVVPAPAAEFDVDEVLRRITAEVQAAKDLALEAQQALAAAPGSVRSEQRQAENEAGRGTGIGQLAGGGLALAGFVALLDRLRRGQQRRRRPGQRVGRVAERAVPTELAARSTADFARGALCDGALRALAGVAHEAGRRLPTVSRVLADDDSVTMLFTEAPGEPLLDAVAGDDGHSWTLDAESIEARGGERFLAPVPALVSLGVEEPGSGLVHLVNLEASGAVTITGAGEYLQELLKLMAIELATTPRADALRVVLVGFGSELGRLERVEVAPSLSEVIDGLEQEAVQFAAALGESGDPTPYVARVHGAAELWEPTVVLCAGREDAEAAERLVALGNDPRSGVVAVVAGNVAGASRTFEVFADHVVDPDDHRRLVRPRFSEVMFSAAGLLVEAAVELPDGIDETEEDAEEHGGLVRVTQEPEPEPPVRSDVAPMASMSEDPEIAGDDHLAAADSGDAGLEVRILGPVEVWAGDRAQTVEFERGKSLELVVYLALHRGGATPEVVRTALWPERLTHANTLPTTAYLARNELGAAADGSLYLPQVAKEGRYRLASSVVLDHERLVDALRRARDESTDQAIVTLRSALSLVRGEPFTGAALNYHWAHAEALVTSVTADVVDAAHLMAELCLSVEDAEGAWWATQAGLLGNPGNEQLYRDRMLAAEQRGSLTMVDDVWRELLHSLEEPGSDVADMPHDQTVALYERIRRGRAVRAAQA